MTNSVEMNEEKFMKGKNKYRINQYVKFRQKLIKCVGECEGSLYEKQN